jgi:hypothetical protein
MALPILTKYRGLTLEVTIAAMEMLENDGRHTIYSVEVYDADDKTGRSDMPLGAAQTSVLSEAIAEAFSTLPFN